MAVVLFVKAWSNKFTNMAEFFKKRYKKINNKKHVTIETNWKCGRNQEIVVNEIEFLVEKQKT